MDVKLTKDADVLVCVLYKEYCQRRIQKSDKATAKYFGSSEDIQRELMPEQYPAEVDETCRELSRSGLIDVEYADDIAYHVWLSDSGIIYMENRFIDGVKSVLDHLGKIKGILPI